MPKRQNTVYDEPGMLDRIAFATYFMGAIFPLVALAVVVERYVLPDLGDPVYAMALLGLVISLSALSLSSFFLLRRSARASLQRMDDDNLRLASLLRVSSSLAWAEHGHAAAATAANSALELAAADVAFVLTRSSTDEHPVLLESAGSGAEEVFATKGKMITELASLVMSEGRPVLRGAADSPKNEEAKEVASAAVVPIPGNDGNVHGALAVIHETCTDAFDPAQLDALTTLAALVSVSLSNSELRDAQRNFFAHMTEILVTALDAHLDYHRGHGKRVAELANRLGREIELDESTLHRLHFAAMLHDIGMLKLDRTQKMNTKACEKHTTIGGRMLGGIKLWEDLAPLVAHHHEWYDGAGYPNGLAGEDIPLESRIIALCDAWDTMTSEASYKIAHTLEEAIAELEVGSGIQFDPELVKSFLKLIESGVITV